MRGRLMEHLRGLIMPVERIDSYQDEIRGANLRAMRNISVCGLCISYILTLLSLPGIGILRLLWPYAVLALLFTLSYGVTVKVLPRHPQAILPVLYGQMVLLDGVGILMGTLLGVNTNATTFLLLLLVLPTFVIDHPWRINLISGIMAVVFCLIVTRVKTGAIMSLDLSNTLVLLPASMIFTSLNVRRQLHSFELRRREKTAMDEKESLINAIPTGIGVFEIRGQNVKQTYLNDGFFRLMADTREHRMRSDAAFIDSIFPADRPLVQSAIRRVMDGADGVIVNCRALRGDGSYMWVRFSSSVARRTPELTLVYTTYVSMEEEVKSRDALEQSRQALQAAIDSAGMTVWEYDCVKHCIVQSQGSMLKHGFGAVLEQVPESMIENGYVQPVSREDYLAMFRELQEKKHTVQGDFLVRSETRSGCWWEHIIMTPEVDEQGRLLRAVGTSLDVTERKKREEQYYQQLGIMAESDEQNMIAKAQYDLTKQHLVYYSALRDDAVPIPAQVSYEEALTRLLQAQPDGKSREKACDLFDRARLLRDFAAGRTEGSISYRRSLPGRATEWANTRYLLSAEPRTGDVMLFVYCFDDTARVIERRIVEQLGESEYDLIGVIDVGTGSYSVRKKKDDMMPGLPPAGSDYMTEVLRIVATQVPSPQEQAMLLQALTMAQITEQLKHKSLLEQPYSAVSPDGALRRKKLQLQYLDDSRATILMTCNDITGLYLQEQEQLVKTQQALLAAQQATRAKTDFLSRMSHDIRTPLNAILGTAALARDELEHPEAMAEYLGTIDASGRFLLGLINDILDVSKIESGRIELRPEVCLVSEYVNSIEASIRPLMEKKHIRFTLHMDCGLKAIMVDHVRHHQIFFNLLSNAAKYTGEGGEVVYETSRIPAPEGMVGVRNVVRDNGLGMTEAYMKHLFEPFSRDSNAAINQTEGSGLGLCIVKSIVDAMGGTISVRSELGKGSEFTVDLFTPMVDESAIEQKDAPTEDASRLQGLRVLLVEDNPVNTSIATRLLERKGCVVTSVTNGQAAVDSFRDSAPGAVELILMDIRMPVMNGLDAARAIRSLKRTDAARVPIVAMTADAFNEDVTRTREAGMNGHLSKPVAPDKLYSELLRALREADMLGKKGDPS